MNDTEKQAVRAMLGKGHATPVIAATVGVTQVEIERLISEERLLRRKRLPSDFAEIEEAIREMGTVDKVATHFGVTREAVYRRIRIAKQQEEDDG